MFDVLFVDDDLGMQDLVGSLLQQARTPFRLARDGREALRLAADQWPGVVLLDLRLKGAIDGWKVWDTLSARANSRSLRVIVMAGAMNKGDLEQALQRRAWAILHKPVSDESLVQCLRTALAEAGAHG